MRVADGSSTWARTRDLRINSPALYQLSYRGINLVLTSKKIASKRCQKHQALACFASLVL